VRHPTLPELSKTLRNAELSENPQPACIIAMYEVDSKKQQKQIRITYFVIAQKNIRIRRR
jgi:hypothetical protein